MAPGTVGCVVGGTLGLHDGVADGEVVSPFFDGAALGAWEGAAVVVGGLVSPTTVGRGDGAVLGTYDGALDTGGGAGRGVVGLGTRVGGSVAGHEVGGPAAGRMVAGRCAVGSAVGFREGTTIDCNDGRGVGGTVGYRKYKYNWLREKLKLTLRGRGVGRRVG